MGRTNRTCIICGTKYEYCSKCSDKVLAQETWRNIYCSEKCRNVFSVLERYAAKRITADDAIKEFNSMGVKLEDISKKHKATLDSIEANRTKAPVKMSGRKNRKRKIVNDD